MPNYTLQRRIKTHLDALGMKLGDAKPEPGRGSTDVGNVSYLAPTACAGFPITDGIVPWHSTIVHEAAGRDSSYDAMFTAGKAVALVGLECLENPETIAAAKDEWQQKVTARQG